MNDKEELNRLFEMVKSLRKAQKLYYKNYSPTYKKERDNMERAIDTYISSKLKEEKSKEEDWKTNNPKLF